MEDGPGLGIVAMAPGLALAVLLGRYTAGPLKGGGMKPMLKTVPLTLAALTVPAVALAQETTDSGLRESPDSPVLLLLLIGVIVLAFLGGGLWAMKRRARKKEGER